MSVMSMICTSKSLISSKIVISPIPFENYCVSDTFLECSTISVDTFTVCDVSDIFDIFIDMFHAFDIFGIMVILNALDTFAVMDICVDMFKFLRYLR